MFICFPEMNGFYLATAPAHNVAHEYQLQIMAYIDDEYFDKNVQTQQLGAQDSCNLDIIFKEKDVGKFKNIIFSLQRFFKNHPSLNQIIKNLFHI